MDSGETSSRTRSTVIGAGYLGLTHATCLAEFGHDVLAVDTDARKVAQMASGTAPFFEPGLQELLRKQLDTGRLRFTASHADAARFGDIHFLCVGTPQAPDGSADLSQVYAAADALAPHLTGPCLIAGKSTVPVGTARALAARIAARAPAGTGAEIIWNPEFLREGSAVQDSLLPDRIVLGTVSQHAAERLKQVYAVPIARGVPLLEMDLETAELVKVSANAFLATRLSFINALAEVCEATGADVVALAGALARDERIGGRFLTPGLGYGGGCLPKDVRAFASVAGEARHRLAGDGAHRGGRDQHALPDAHGRAGPGTRGRLAGRLPGRCAGGRVQAGQRRRAQLGQPGRVRPADGRGCVGDHPRPRGHRQRGARPARSALGRVGRGGGRRRGPDRAPHRLGEYRLLDPHVLGAAVARRNVIDTRSALDERRWRSAGWSFHALGRP